jgi:hypothetical protein
MSKSRLAFVEIKENGGETNAPGVLAGDEIVQAFDTSDWSDVTALYASFASHNEFVRQLGDGKVSRAGHTALILLSRRST